MKRRLVKQGAATMMVSLPSKWIRANNLDKGDEVDLTELESNIIISSTERMRGTRVKLNVSNLDLLTNRAIISAYTSGLEEIELSFSDLKQLKKIQKEIIPELIGFEIIEQRSGSVLIKDIAGTEKQNVENLFKRILFILNSLIEELIDSIDNKKDLLQIAEIDSSVNKLVYYCQRLVNRGNFLADRTIVSNFLYILYLLEDLGDYYKRFIYEFIESKEKEKNIKEVLESQKKFFNLFQKAYSSKSTEDIIAFSKYYKNLNFDKVTYSKLGYISDSIAETIIKMNNYLLLFLRN